MRPDWDTYHMAFAHIASVRSSCQRRKVGCAIIKENHVLVTGYNGAPSGVASCLDWQCLRASVEPGKDLALCRASHAEQNAIATAAKFGIALEGSHLYCTHKPCSICAKLIIQSGIRSVHYAEDYPDPLADELFAESGVVLYAL